jgi:hypothetical protein
MQNYTTRDPAFRGFVFTSLSFVLHDYDLVWHRQTKILPFALSHQSMEEAELQEEQKHCKNKKEWSWAGSLNQ